MSAPVKLFVGRVGRRYTSGLSLNKNFKLKNPDYVARGLKAAMHNPNVSPMAKDHAAHQLEEMNGGHVRRQLGYKATLSNPNTSTEAKKLARSILDSVPVMTEEGKNEKRVMGGYKATLKNPHTSVEAKDQAEKVLKDYGYRP